MGLNVITLVKYKTVTISPPRVVRGRFFGEMGEHTESYRSIELSQLASSALKPTPILTTTTSESSYSTRGE